MGKGFEYVCLDDQSRKSVEQQVIPELSAQSSDWLKVFPNRILLNWNMVVELLKRAQQVLLQNADFEFDEDED
jgi:hypothetical protein